MPYEDVCKYSESQSMTQTVTGRDSRGPRVYMRPASSPSRLGAGPKTRTLTIMRVRCPTRPRVTTFATYVPSRVLTLPWRLCTLNSRSPESQPSLNSRLPSSRSRFGSGNRTVALPSLSSRSPGSSSSRERFRSNPEAGTPETIQRVFQVGLRVFREVGVRYVIVCGSSESGPEAFSCRAGARVARMYGSEEKSFRSASGTFAARWKTISQVYLAGVDIEEERRRIDSVRASSAKYL